MTLKAQIIFNSRMCLVEDHVHEVVAQPLKND